ncbi:MAG: hypothetical protein V3574_03200 [Candidatus Moraniibacteriota bacterium]
MKKRIFWLIGIPIVALGSLAIGIASNDEENYFNFEKKIISPGETLILSFNAADIKIVAESDFYGCGRYSIIQKNLAQTEKSITQIEEEVPVEEYFVRLKCEGKNVVVRQ